MSDNHVIFNKISIMMRNIKRSISNGQDLPQSFFFSNGFPDPKFKITVELVEEDTIVDSKGRKWIMSKE